MEKNIYIVLTQSGSFFSQLIKVYTRAKYSHVSLSLSSDLEPMYSFGRRHPYNPVWGGFVQEHLTEGTFKRFHRTRAAVYFLPVSEETYDGIKKDLEEMYEHKEKFGYDSFGVFLAAMRVEMKRNNKYYCSAFVKSVLQKYQVPGSENLKKFVEPCDFMKLPNLTLIYQGLLKEYPHGDTRKK